MRSGLKRSKTASNRARLAILSVGLWLVGTDGGASQPQSEPLFVGMPVTREMGTSDSHAYSIRLDPGQYLRVAIEQQGGDVAATLLAPDGARVAEAASTLVRRGGDRLSFIAVAGGVHRIEVRAAGQSARSGRYEIRVEELRLPTDADRSRLAAEAAYIAAQALRGTQKAEALRSAVPKYEEAIRLSQALGDVALEADAQHNLALTWDYLGEYAKSIGLYETALQRARALGDGYREASTLSNLGVVLRISGETRRAIDSYEHALPLWRAAGDLAGEGSTLHNLGSAYWIIGDNDRALDYQQQALAVRERVNDRTGVGETLITIGMSHRARGEVQTALDYYQRALALKRETGDRRGEARVLHNAGVAYSVLGEFPRALQYLRDSLAMHREAGDRQGEAGALQSAATATRLHGDLDGATALLEQVLALRRQLGDRRGQASALAEIGLTHEVRGEPRRALELYGAALPLAREIGDRRTAAFVLDNMGTAYTSLGETGRARECFEQALELQRTIGDRHGQIETLSSLALVSRNTDDLTRAQAEARAAIELVDSVRAGVAVRSLRSSYAGLNEDVHKLYVDILMRLHRREPAAGHAVTALLVNEQMRARAFRETLLETRADLRQGVDPALVERERRLRSEINAAERGRLQLLEGKPAASRLAAAERELERLLSAHQQVEAEIRRRRARSGLVAEAMPRLADIQQALDGGTVLLEYALGKDRSYAWMITRSSIDSVELPEREAIEKIARRAYEMLVATRQTDARLQARQSAADLSRVILVPVIKHLAGKRVLIVADGALEYIPFGALPLPNAGLAVSASSPPMIVGHEVVSLPSASVLSLLRDEQAARPRASKALAIFADPVLDRRDSRVEGAKRSTASAEAEHHLSADRPEPIDDVSRSARDTGATFERLRYSRVEADTIAAMTTAADTLKALDFRASREVAVSRELEQYRIVHFATHGLINSQRPELSGVVLSLVDEHGRAQDGFLRLHDIYNLKLAADLVVLSACQTALGREIKGEGLVGLTRGFMHAGSPRVVASLWEVRDRATAELMKRFYRGMLTHRLSPAAALRAAQISMWKEPRWSAPFYWAGFVLQGDWR